MNQCTCTNINLLVIDYDFHNTIASKEAGLVQVDSEVILEGPDSLIIHLFGETINSTSLKPH